MCRLGATDREVAEALNVTEKTLNTWKHAHPKFLQSLTLGKAASDQRVELSLYRKATGYSFEAVKIFCSDGAVVEVPYIEHVPPSDRAIEYWLNNRKRKKWQNRVHAELAGDPKRPLTYTPESSRLLGDYYAKLAQAAAAAHPDPATDSPVGSAGPGREEPGDGEGFSPR